MTDLIINLPVLDPRLRTQPRELKRFFYFNNMTNNIKKEVKSTHYVKCHSNAGNNLKRLYFDECIFLGIAKNGFAKVIITKSERSGKNNIRYIDENRLIEIYLPEKPKIDYAFYAKYYGDKIIKMCNESIEKDIHNKKKNGRLDKTT